MEWQSERVREGILHEMKRRKRKETGVTWRRKKELKAKQLASDDQWRLLQKSEC